MRRCSQSWHRHKNGKERREKVLQRSRKGVLAREVKRLANPVEREPRYERFYPLQFAVRDKRNGDVSQWIELKSGRDMGRRVATVLRYYSSGWKPRKALPRG
jgi:hypothetical protein